MSVRNADVGGPQSFGRRSLLRSGASLLGALSSTPVGACPPTRSAEGGKGASSRPAVIRHIEERFARPAATIDQRILRVIPKLDPTVVAKARAGDAAWAARERRSGPPLWLFDVRDTGDLLALDGRTADIFVYQIGNPLTAESMIRLRPAAAMYAPLRFVLYEVGGGSVLAYDLPSDQFGQFGDPRVTAIARDLDLKVRRMIDKLREE